MDDIAYLRALNGAPSGPSRFYFFLSRTTCTDGYLKLYLKGQEATDSYDKFDHEMCGNKSNPSYVVSDGPRLVMVFSSGELQAQGFKAK